MNIHLHAGNILNLFEASTIEWIVSKDFFVIASVIAFCRRTYIYIQIQQRKKENFMLNVV